MTLPDDALARKTIPLCSGLLDYFPSALVAVAGLSAKGNDQHNPGQPLHWDRSKSGDEADALVRHLMQRGTVDTDGVLHSTKVAWRALALLQKELETLGAPVATGATNVPKAQPFPAPDSDLSPAAVALAELHDEDAPTESLLAGKASPPAYDGHPLSHMVGDAVANGVAHESRDASAFNPVSQTSGD